MSRAATAESRRLLTDADAIITCNENEARLLREKYPGKRIVVQPHGVPLAIYQEDRREEAYAGVRVASNLGALVGPPLGALLVVLGGWTAFLLGIAAIGLAGGVFTALFVPGRPRVPDAEKGRGSLRAVVRDRPFALLLLSSLLAYGDYCGFETVLPVIAVASYGLAPSTWGLLVAISPALVVLGQLRLTRAAACRRPRGSRPRPC